MIHQSKFYFFRFRLIAILIPFFLSGVLMTSLAQQIVVSSGKGNVFNKFENRLDALIVMYNIQPTDELTVLLPDDSLNVSWSIYKSGAEISSSIPVVTGAAKSRPRFISNQVSVAPVDLTGYQILITGTVNGRNYNKTMNVWVIDYKKYIPVLNSLTPADPTKTSCDKLELTLDASIPEMFYYTFSGQKYFIDRVYKIQYETLEWGADTWNPITVTKSLKPVNKVFTLDDPPLKDTYFTLTVDTFASGLNIAPLTIKSSNYLSVRVIAKIKTETTVRTEKNEGDRPENVSTLSASAPLDINFIAIPNGNVNFYSWDILSNGVSLLNRTDETHRYTFTVAGTYVVRLRVENAWCAYTDSITVKVSESAIYAPNVFTPNGDEVNEEFRFAYKSIIEFQCWIFNRSGKKLYSWTDPQKGWDGTYNGKPVPEGAYFFVAKAKGSDGREYNLKGDINLLRGKK